MIRTHGDILKHRVYEQGKLVKRVVCGRPLVSRREKTKNLRVIIYR